jgi:hypothetical protein
MVASIKDPKSIDFIHKIHMADLKKGGGKGTDSMSLINPSYLTVVGGVAQHSNKEISQYLARRNAGVEKLYYNSGAVLNPKASFELVDLEKFKLLCSGTRDTHFVGVALTSNTTPIFGATAAIVSEHLCDFKWSCSEGSTEEALLRRIKKEISFTFDALGKGPTPEVIQQCFSVGHKPTFYSSIIVGALAF